MPSLLVAGRSILKSKTCRPACQTVGSGRAPSGAVRLDESELHSVFSSWRSRCSLAVVGSERGERPLSTTGPEGGGPALRLFGSLEGERCERGSAIRDTALICAKKDLVSCGARLGLKPPHLANLQPYRRYSLPVLSEEDRLSLQRSSSTIRAPTHECRAPLRQRMNVQYRLATPRRIRMHRLESHCPLLLRHAPASPIAAIATTATRSGMKHLLISPQLLGGLPPLTIGNAGILEAGARH